MSGLDERPIEFYSNDKEQFSCRKCHNGVKVTVMHYGEKRWWFEYICLTCGYEGQKMDRMYEIQ